MGSKKTHAGLDIYVPDPASDIVWTDVDGVVHIRNSERGSLDKCPQQWWWSWRDGLRPKETPQALWFGSAIHEALADYYRPGRKRSKNFIDKFREYAEMEAEYVRIQMGGLDEDVWAEARSLGEAMLQGYVREYDGDRRWDVIGTEQSFEISIPWLDEDSVAKMQPNLRRQAKLLKRIVDFDTDVFVFNGTIDGVYIDLDDRKRRKLMEHKTAKTIGLGHLTMDNQAGAYWLAAQTLGLTDGWLHKGENITEITYNFLRKALPDERPRDAQGYATNLPRKEHFIAALQTLDVEVANGKPLDKATLNDLKIAAGTAGLVVLGDRSSRQSSDLFLRHPVRKTPAQRASQLARLKSDVTKMALYVSGLIVVDKSPNRDTCPMCPYRDMCELHETGAGWVEYRDAMYRAENPYAVHQKSASA